MPVASIYLSGADPEQLRRGLSLNFAQWFKRTGLGGRGRVDTIGRYALVHWPDQNDFASISVDVLRPDFLARLLSRAGKLDPPKGINLWLTQTSPARVMELVCAGFAWAFSPHYMSCDVAQIQPVALSPGISVEQSDDEKVWDQFDHPYSTFNTGPDWRSHVTARHIAARQRPRRIWFFLAWLDGRPVGHAAVLLNPGKFGVAGIFDVGVRPDCRNRGIGRVVTAAACEFARSRGAHYAILSASQLGEPIYRRLGFRTLCHGQTWNLKANFAAAPITNGQLQLLGGIVRGDCKALDRIPVSSRQELVSTPLPNGMMPLHLAVRLKQSAVADWLLESCAPTDLPYLWDLGRKDQVRGLLGSQPELVNALDEAGRTLMHIAALRGDVELAKLALSANPDLTIEDPTYHGTPLGWAKHFSRAEIVQLIEKHQA